MNDKAQGDLWSQKFEEGTKGYAFQRYYRECQEIGEKYKPFMRANPGILDYVPYEREIKEAQRRFTQELKRIAREEEAMKLNAKQKEKERAD